MNVTATLFGQMITFVIFVWFIKAFLWEPLTTAMEERSKKIADGLASAELGKKKMAEAATEYEKTLKEAKDKASDVLNQAQQQSSTIIDEARSKAKLEANKILESAKQQIDQETNIAKESLRRELSTISLECAEKIIDKEIDKNKHNEIIEKALKSL
ncbi:MAG: F0F1 ATP synthase subunit B [Gammaproteobacteria bacterium]|nr:F0F1 ATP synthase subunit B [Gammaproteobacteria bacterium]|tara:strand:+ start:256 stop:726 length:471 start_codon:yes stop_codon:yes gene_type:complete